MQLLDDLLLSTILFFFAGKEMIVVQMTEIVHIVPVFSNLRTLRTFWYVHLAERYVHLAESREKKICCSAGGACLIHVRLMPPISVASGVGSYQ